VRVGLLFSLFIPFVSGLYTDESIGSKSTAMNIIIALAVVLLMVIVVVVVVVVVVRVRKRRTSASGDAYFS